MSVRDRSGPTAADPIRRVEDGELLGSVRRDGDGWLARTVFGGVLARRPTEAEARDIVERDGLASLRRRWFYRRRGASDWVVVLIQEAWPGRARLVVGPYALPGAATLEIRAEDLDDGDELTLEPPDEDLAQYA